MAATNSQNYHITLDSFFSYDVENSYANLIHVNIRSLRRNFNSFLAEIHCVKRNIQFIVLSEVWIGSDELNLYNIPGYSILANCNDDYRAGGVVCYVKDGILADKVNFNMVTADVLLIDIKHFNMYFKLVCFYRLQSFSENDFINELSNTLPNLKNNIILVGDFNIDLLDDCLSTQSYLSLMDGCGFQSMVNTPTRITHISQSCIDHIFIRQRQLNSFESAVFDIDLTDHCVIGLKWEISHKIGKTDKINLSNQITLDYNLIKEKLERTNWDICYNYTDINSCYDIFNNILSDIINSSTINNNSKILKAKLISPWMTTKLLNKLKIRKKLYRTYRKRPYDNAFKNYYFEFCTNLKNEIDSVKKQYYSNKLNQCNGDSQQQWKIINELTGRNVKRGVNRITLDNGCVVSDPNVVADTINKYFISVQSADCHGQGQTALGAGCRTAAPPPLLISPAPCVHSFFMFPTTETEVVNIINQLKNKRSTGFDSFTTKLIKEIKILITPVLTYLINCSLTTGIFPDKLKKSIVVPLMKDKNSSQLANLRPISLLSIFSKIFEKIVNIRLINYLNKNNFININQYGFRKGTSTEDALINVTNEIYTNLNESNKVSGLFIDFRKAFDLVNHTILLNKLEAIGIRGTALNWFKSYLTGRNQQVRIESCLSPPLLLNSGVPQGSILSSTLFLIFINDLLEQTFFGRISAFADDIAFFYAEKQIENLNQKIKTDISLLQRWCYNNKMQINVSKTKYINFGFMPFVFEDPLTYHSNNCIQNFPCDCQVIEQVNHFKYLGINIDQKLNWGKHIQELNNKIRATIRTFYFLNKFCNTHLLRNLYYTLVQSRLQYGLICWGGAYKILIDKLRVSQNHIVRILLRKNLRSSSFPLFQQIKALPIQHLYVYKVLTLFYKRSGNEGTNFLVYGTRSVSERHFRIPKVNKEIFRLCFQYVGPKFFNKLPFNIKSRNKSKLFCNSVYDWLIERSDVSFFNSVIS